MVTFEGCVSGAAFVVDRGGFRRHGPGRSGADRGHGPSDLVFLTCPLQLLTLGLFIFVVNAIVFGFTAWVARQLDVQFHVDGFIAAFLGALVISAVSLALSRLLRRNPVAPRPA